MCSADDLPQPEKLHVDLTGAPETMLATLYGKALDASSKNPILGDRFAHEVVSRLDYDWGKTGMTARNSPSVTVRSAQFDDWARQFLAEHERATVLHVGCGLDSRVFRLDPHADVEWYDIDYPDVIALFQQLYPQRAHHHLVPSSITDPAWLDAIAPDRPTLLLAEGVTPYLTEDDGVALLQRVIERFPSGELQFDVFNRFAVKTQKINAVVRRSGSTMHWAIDGPDDIIRRFPGVQLLAAVGAFDADTFQRVSRVNRFLGRLLSLIPALRGMSQYHRYTF